MYIPALRDVHFLFCKTLIINNAKREGTHALHILSFLIQRYKIFRRFPNRPKAAPCGFASFCTVLCHFLTLPAAHEMPAKSLPSPLCRVARHSRRKQKARRAYFAALPGRRTDKKNAPLAAAYGRGRDTCVPRPLYCYLFCKRVLAVWLKLRKLCRGKR